MAKARKGARNAVIDGVKYRWRAADHGDWTSLTVWPDELPGATISCSIGFGSDPWLDMGSTPTIVITARLVRKVIEHAMRSHAYDPRTKGAPLTLRSVENALDVADSVS